MDEYYRPSESDEGTSRGDCKIFVGALSWQTTEETLRRHFESYGAVHSVELVRDRQTGGACGIARTATGNSITYGLYDIIMYLLFISFTHYVIITSLLISLFLKSVSYL